MKDKRAIIDTYTTQIYPYDLVVANMHVTLEELMDLFTYSDDVELDNNILEADCCTAVVRRKSNKDCCILVKLNSINPVRGKSKKLELINTASHEATHVALDIYEGIHQNICFCSPEPFCYLQAWATECIYNTFTRKP